MTSMNEREQARTASASGTQSGLIPDCYPESTERAATHPGRHTGLAPVRHLEGSAPTWNRDGGEEIRPENEDKGKPQGTRVHVTRLGEYELEQFSSQEKNELVMRYKHKVLASMKSSPMAANSVWITLEKGSLVIRGEISCEANDEQWPTDEEARDVVQAVIRQRAVSMGDGAQHLTKTCEGVC